MRSLLDDEDYELFEGGHHHPHHRDQYVFVSEQAHHTHSMVSDRFKSSTGMAYSSRIHHITLLLYALAHELADAEMEMGMGMAEALRQIVLVFVAVTPIIASRAQGRGMGMGMEMGAGHVHLVNLLLFSDAMFLAHHIGFIADSYMNANTLVRHHHHHFHHHHHHHHRHRFT